MSFNVQYRESPGDQLSDFVYKNELQHKKSSCFLHRYAVCVCLNQIISSSQPPIETGGRAMPHVLCSSHVNAVWEMLASLRNQFWKEAQCWRVPRSVEIFIVFFFFHYLCRYCEIYKGPLSVRYCFGIPIYLAVTKHLMCSKTTRLSI